MQTVIVTGVASGIGKACYDALENSTEFTPFGIDVVASARTDLALNLALKAELEEAVDIIKRGHDKVGGLVNCAGVQIKKPLGELTHEHWLESFAINAVAPFLLLGKLLPLISHGGSVVNIGSIHSSATIPGMAAYAASKGALASGTRAAALDLASLGIRVNCVSLGAVRTKMLMANILGSGRTGDEDPLQQLEDSIPVGRIAAPEEIADLVVFLLSDKARYITGGEFLADGGVLATLASEAPARESGHQV